MKTEQLVKHVISMARGIVILDENLFALSKELESQGMRVLKVKSGLKDKEIIEHSLSGRIFITNNSKDFIDDASDLEYGIIATENVSKDPKFLSKLISDEIIKNKIWSKKKGFILFLNNNKKSIFKQL
jgi:hypothetical protein